jgi:hypothetical protein
MFLIFKVTINGYKPKFNPYNKGSANSTLLNTRGRGNFGNRNTRNIAGDVDLV